MLCQDTMPRPRGTSARPPGLGHSQSHSTPTALPAQLSQGLGAGTGSTQSQPRRQHIKDIPGTLTHHGKQEGMDNDRRAVGCHPLPSLTRV